MSEYIHTIVLMRIIGDHPHAGDFCHPTGESSDSITEKFFFGEPMYKMKLVNCPHGGIEFCYVSKRRLEMIKYEENS